MGHTPYGYKIENGKAVICNEDAEKIRMLYKNYLSGMALSIAAKEAGINAYHGTARRLLENKHYLGGDFHPAIIDKDTFGKAAEEIQLRACKLGRLNRVKPTKPIAVPTRFHLVEAAEHFERPKLQAEYIYSLIENEVV